MKHEMCIYILLSNKKRTGQSFNMGNVCTRPTSQGENYVCQQDMWSVTKENQFQ